MSAAPARPMGYTPPEESVTLRFRASDAFRKELEDAVRLWKAHAKARGDDVAAIDMSHYIRSTLAKANQEEFKSYGGRPKTEADWDKIESAIAATVPLKKKP